MRYFKWIFAVVILCYNLQGTVFSEQMMIEKKAKDIPNDNQLLKLESLKSFPHIDKKLGYFSWPSAEKISVALRKSDEPLSVAEEKLVKPGWISTEKETVTEAKRMAEKWIREILKDNWIPTDIFDRLIALDSDIDGYDTIRVRYEMGGYYIQIVQTSSCIGLTIKDLSSKEMLMSEEIEKFFNEFDKIKQSSLVKVESFVGGQEGIPDETKLCPDKWWGSTHWWKNNEALIFFISKFYGGAGLPFGLPKDWF